MGVTHQSPGSAETLRGMAQEVRAPMHPDDTPYLALEQLEDRVRHAIVFCEATLRALREALALLEAEKSRP